MTSKERIQCKHKIRRRRVDKQACLIRLSADIPCTPDCVLMCCAAFEKRGCRPGLSDEHADKKYRPPVATVFVVGSIYGGRRKFSHVVKVHSYK